MTLPAYASGEKQQKKNGMAKPSPLGATGRPGHHLRQKEYPERTTFFSGKIQGLLGGSSQLVSGW